MIEVTETAREKIRGALEKSDPPRSHLRIDVRSANGAFEYRMAALDGGDVAEGDVTVEAGPVTIVLDPDSARNIEGATIDFHESLIESGFRIDNPNEPESPAFGSGEREDLEGPVPDRVRMLLDQEINPTIAAHGGVVRMVDYRDGKVFLAFGGGCHGCGMVDVTLKQGIETRIREAVPEVVEVVDTTDHSSGENPYY